MVAMGVFPAIYSTLSPQALIDGVLSRYEIGTIDRCLFWNRGLSDIYLVETQKKSYILKVSHHHWRSELDIQFELEFLDFLHQQNIPVANPLKTKANKLLVVVNAVEGNRYAALFPYAPGEVPQGDLNVDQSTIMGQTLGQIHHKSLEFDNLTPRQHLNVEYLLDDSFEVISPYLRNEDELAYLEQARIAKIKQQLTCLEQTSPLWSVLFGAILTVEMSILLRITKLLCLISISVAMVGECLILPSFSRFLLLQVSNGKLGMLF